ncbi:MAG: hypothetical protein ACOY3E_02755 [Pseudomonadota bacterium]
MLKIGDRIHIGGGYDMEPAWLNGGSGYTGTVLEFLESESEKTTVLVELDAPLSFNQVTSSEVLLSLRYVGAKWTEQETCHVTLCAKKPNFHLISVDPHHKRRKCA